MLQHGDINAFKWSFNLRVRADPEAIITMDRALMLDEFLTDNRTKPWLKRWELEPLARPRDRKREKNNRLWQQRALTSRFSQWERTDSIFDCPSDGIPCASHSSVFARARAMSSAAWPKSDGLMARGHSGGTTFRSTRPSYRSMSNAIR